MIPKPGQVKKGQSIGLTRVFDTPMLMLKPSLLCRDADQDDDDDHSDNSDASETQFLCRCFRDPAHPDADRTPGRLPAASATTSAWPR